MAGNTVRSFRNRITGVVEDYPESLADAFDYLELVDEDAKTLINPPQTPETVQGHTDHQEAKRAAKADAEGKSE